VDNNSNQQKKKTGKKLGLTYLLFAEEGEMQQNLEGLRVGGQDDELGNTAVECFGRWWLVGGHS
jgi:hypothetical protein